MRHLFVRSFLIRRAIFAFALLTFAVPGSVQLVQAQSVIFGGDFVFAKPVGEFGENVKQGFGLSGFATLAKPQSPLSLRVDLNYVNHGNKRQRSFWGPFSIDRNTSNNIFAFGIGPQLMVTSGPIRPYINAQGGFSHYYTQTTLDGIDSDVFETTRTESSTWKLSYGGGGGVMIPISTGAATLVTINLGAQYYVSGRTTYLTKNDIHPDEQSGTIMITPRTTDVKYLSYRLGMTIGF